MSLQLSPVIAGGGSGSGGGSAPSDATYITQTPNASLSNEQALSTLATGLMQVTTATGVVSSVTTSAGIATLISDETGTAGSLVFSIGPTLTGTSPLTLTQTIATTGSPTLLTVTGAAHTTLTASTEVTDINLNLARTVEFATGNFALQRAMRIQGPTYSAVGASMIDKAVTVSIGPPVAGTNMTITDRYALRLTGSLEMAGAPAVIQVTDSDLGLTIRGNRSSSGLSAQLVVDAVNPTTPLVRLLDLAEAGVEKFLVYAHGGFAVVQSAESQGGMQLFKATLAAQTGNTASTEVQNFSISTYTRTWLTGAITDQRENVFMAPTYAFVGASVVTNAATLYISGAPIAGANATLTNAYALWVDSGVARFDGLTVGGTAGFTDITANSITVGNTGLHILDTNATHDLIIAPGSNLTADRTLTVTTGDTDRTLTISGNATISQDYSTSGAPAFARLGVGAAADAVNTVTVVQAVATTGSPNMFTATGGAHTTLTASTEATDVYFNLARTVQFATGALTTQRAIRVSAPTYAFVGASTLTTAVTLEVDKPVAGTNATITNIRAIRSNGILEVNNGAITQQIIISGGTTSVADIEVTTSATGLRLIGNIAASTSTSTVADVNITANATRTAGNILRVSNGALNRMSVNYQGTVLACETATSAGTARSFLAANPAHTGQTAGTEINNWQSPAYTRTWASNTNITTQREWFLGIPTYAFASATGTITTAATFYVEGAPAVGANAAITNSYSVWVDAGNTRLDGNLLLGTTVAGATAANGVLALGNGATEPTTSTDLVQLYAVDISAGNATLGIFTETAVVTETLVSDRSLKVKVNGTFYRICLVS